MHKTHQFGALLLALTMALAMAGLTACVPGARAAEGIPISGPGDLYYLSIAINDQSAKNSGLEPVSMSISSHAIDDLKGGRAEAAFIGREPTPAELQGLKDYVVALDAVCIIIDENTYVGGKSGGVTRYTSKVTGFRALSFADVKQIFSGQGWQWQSGYYAGNPDIDPGSFLWKMDEYAFLPEPKGVSSAFIYPPGKYDTQTVLYEDLGLDEISLRSKLTIFTSDRFNKEEEAVAYEYTGSAFSANYGAQTFAFKLGFASRRAMTVAPQHVPVRAVSVDGVDPLNDVQSIYDGTYKLGRKIHLLIRQNGPAAASQLADYLTSAEGQKLIGEAGYLPISQAQGK